MPFFSALKKFKKSWDGYRPLIEVKIYGENILHNLGQFQKTFPQIRFAPVLKSNAYGHGLTETARILDGQNLPFFMVDSLFEARQLRGEGIKTPVLILGYTTAENINSQKLSHAAFGIISLEQLKNINLKLKRAVNFHLKIDTGMRRQGILPEELAEAVNIIKNNRLIQIEGICSHLADADGPDESFSQGQIKLWNELAARAQKELGEIKFKHLTNSAGSDLSGQANVNVGRLGIGLYGFNLSPRLKPWLKPALQMESIISSVRNLKPGDKIGYNITFTAPKNIIAATVPVGYAEGIDRRLSNAGAMTFDGLVCPIIGRVSMNITSIDVSAVAGAHLEQKVTIISKNPEDPNCIENMARICHTIPYEILVRIPVYLRRTVISS